MGIGPKKIEGAVSGGFRLPRCGGKPVSGPDRDGGNGFPAAGDYFPGESVVVKVAHLSAGTVASNPTR